MVSRSISVLVLDVDGVITDGTTGLDPRDEGKRVSFHDLDAVTRTRRRIPVWLATAEDTPAVDAVADRFALDRVIRGAKDKLEALRRVAEAEGRTLDELCYVGDSDRDAPALRAAGWGVVPANATRAARNAADLVLQREGGRGAVAEAIERVFEDPGPDAIPEGFFDDLEHPVEARRLAEALRGTTARGGWVFLCAPREAATDADVADLTRRWGRRLAPLRVPVVGLDPTEGWEPGLLRPLDLLVWLDHGPPPGVRSEVVRAGGAGVGGRELLERVVAAMSGGGSAEP